MDKVKPILKFIVVDNTYGWNYNYYLMIEHENGDRTIKAGDGESKIFLAGCILEFHDLTPLFTLSRSEFLGIPQSVSFLLQKFEHTEAEIKEEVPNA